MNSTCCHFSFKKNKEIKQLAKLLKVVAAENRLCILCLLQKKSLCVCEIMESLKLPQNLISHHLGVLEKENLVTAKKKGQRVYYSLTLRGRKIVEAVLKLSGKGDII